MRKSKFLVFILIFALLAGINIPARVKAEGVPTLNLYTASGMENVYAGDAYYLGVELQNMEEISAISFTVHYDQSVLSAYNVSDYIKQSGASKDINYSTPGEVNVSVIALDGITTTNPRIQINFMVRGDAAAGMTPITVAVNEALDLDGNSVDVYKNNISVNVNAKPVAPQTLSFTARISSGNNAYIGGNVTYACRFYDTKLFAGGNFNFSYDAEKLRVKTVTPSASLKAATATCLVNSDRPGIVKVSFMDSEPVLISKNTTLVTIVFESLVDEDASTTISFDGDSFCDPDLNPYLVNTVNANVSLRKSAIVIDNPDFTLNQGADTKEGYQTMDVSVEGTSGLAAGDFTISFDKTKLEPVAVDVDEQAVANNRFLVVDDRWNENNGTVKFSFIDTDGVSEDLNLLHIKFKSTGERQFTTNVSASGSNVVNKSFATVNLEYKGVTLDCTPFYQPGDVNQNGTINGDDMIALAKHIAKISVITDADSLKACDMNKDGKVDSSDVTALASYIDELN